MSQEKPLIQIQNASNRMLRSPSHESISTEISLLSLSSLTPFVRIPSPVADSRHRLAVPNAGGGDTSKSSDIWAEEENDLIKNFGVIFKFLGLPKSFSTSDINTNLQLSDPGQIPLRKSTSELDLNQVRCSDIVFKTHFGPASRSCSTWVAVGDAVSSTSQLPSPQGRLHWGPNGAFTPADLIRSVNKKVRQLYIRKRLLQAYRALERLSQSGFDLEKIPIAVPPNFMARMNVSPPVEGSALKIPERKPVKESPLTLKAYEQGIISREFVERDRGRPLSKFERNMMIFTWLHTLEETSYEAME